MLSLREGPKLALPRKAPDARLLIKLFLMFKEEVYLFSKYQEVRLEIYSAL